MSFYFIPELRYNVFSLMGLCPVEVLHLLKFNSKRSDSLTRNIQSLYKSK